MFRLSGLLCLVVAVILGALLFQTSQSVQRAEQELFQTQSQVKMEGESLRVLTAEWDYLNRPERLEKLTLKNLDMDEVRAEKSNFIEDRGAVPEPRVPVLPQVKPKNILQYVSTQGARAVETSKPEKIENSESNSFGKLINEVGGQ